MWNYPNRSLHQAAIDDLKIDRAREIARATAAATRLRREQSAKKALTDYEMDRLATLAKTQRLRAERLARIEGETKKSQQVGVLPRGKRVPRKV